MSKELIEQLRDLANCRHDDLSIGYEAADRIEQLETECDQLREHVTLLRIKLVKAANFIQPYNISAALLDELDEALVSTETK